MRFLIGAFLMLATLLLQPAAPAQTPAKNPSRKVSLQVTFVVVKTSDLDALGTNFDFVAIPEMPKRFLTIATGSVAMQNYLRLTQTVGIKSHVFMPAPAVVSDGGSATFTAHAQFADPADETLPEQGKSFPLLTNISQIDGNVTLIPSVGVEDLVCLDIDSPLGKAQRIKLGAIPSGQQMIINMAVVKAQEASGTSSSTPLILGMNRNTVSEAKELLLFVAPTILIGTPGRAVMTAPEKVVTLNMENGDLQTAIFRMEHQYGIQCIIESGIDAHRTIGIGMTDTPLIQALRFLASAADAQVTRDSNGVYVFAPRPAGVPQTSLLRDRFQFPGGF